MPRKGENIFKRNDGRWKGRYIKARNGNKAIYGYVFGKSYLEVKQKKAEAISRIDYEKIKSRNKLGIKVRLLKISPFNGSKN